MKFSYLCFSVLIVACHTGHRVNSQAVNPAYNEPYRPQVHFSPKQKWMNDPNGMVYYKGIYHLFYQYYPDSTIWGPMHWGHATSHNLIHWEHMPIALYPDSLGYIFSGSVVLDSTNTSGFGKDGQPPLVAIFTHHSQEGVNAGRDDVQHQSIAYSLDDGRTWVKYAANPVIKNPGISDFRDPKVMWYAKAQKWIMTLATKDKVTFYSSPDLKAWSKESEFGEHLGAHGGVWECPDLFSILHEGKELWVLLVSINPGGPNGGSATQYFIGNFDGNKFTTSQKSTQWMDYGPDNYAGVTWSNTGARRILAGWMNNWQYANVVPTAQWRGALTVPRDLSLTKVKNSYFLTSKIVEEIVAIHEKKVQMPQADLRNFIAGHKIPLAGPAIITLSGERIDSFSINLSNASGDNAVIGYDLKNNQFFIDRSNSGNVSFSKEFAGRYTMPRISRQKSFNITLLVDVASVELFADNGLSVMTATMFPDTPYDNIQITAPAESHAPHLEYSTLKSIWTNQTKL